LAEYQKSMELAEAIHRSEPRSFAARFDAFFARLQIADTWRELEPKRGVRELQQCVEMLSELRRDNPAFRDADRLQALLYQAIGDAQIRAGDREGAERSLQQAFQSTRALIDLDPGRRQMRRELALASYDLGRVRLDRGNVNGAREAVFQCLPFVQTLDRSQARPLDLREAARCLELAGRVESAANRPAEAARHYRQAVETWDEFSRRGLRSAFLAASREAVQQRLATLPPGVRKTE
jgi:tetratricopeptide (TPR) repeat protein